LFHWFKNFKTTNIVSSRTLPNDRENKMRGQGLKIGRVKGAVKSKRTRGASHVGLAIYNKKYIKAKEEL
jgi:hypothetical protein